MPPNGHAPLDASKAAARRDGNRFLLPGFDRQWQIDGINFNTIQFGTIWLRRTFTNERHKHIAIRARDEEARQLVRYGNNIAVLFKACLTLRCFFPSPDFFTVIAQKFSAPVGVVENMITVFTDARKAFLRADHMAAERSGANVAVDKWIDARRGMKCLQDRQYRSYREIFDDAAMFFRQMEEQLVDQGGVLPRFVDHYHHPPVSRKRSASPESSAGSRSPKRRQSSTYHGDADPPPSRPQRMVTPLSTTIQIKGTATKQEYWTPISASEQTAPDTYVSHETSDPSELWQRTAQKHTNGSQSTDVPENVSRRSSPDRFPGDEKDEPQCTELSRIGSSDQFGDGEKHHTQHKLCLTEEELAHTASLLSNMLDLQKKMGDWALASSNNALAFVQAALGASDSAIEALQAQVTSLAQNLENVKEDNLVLKKQLARTQGLNSDHNEKTREVQRRLAALEDKLLVDRTTHIQTELASLKSRMTGLESSIPQESSMPAIQDLETRVKCLESKSTTNTSDTAQADQANPRELRHYAQSLEDRITKIGKRANGALQPRDLEGKMADTAARLDRLEKHAKASGENEYASKGFVEGKLKGFESRYAREMEATAKHKNLMRLQEQVKTLQDQSSSQEVKLSRFSEAVDMLSTPKSPGPDAILPCRIDDMAKRVDALSKSQSEKVFQLESALRQEIEEHQKKFDLTLEGLCQEKTNANIETLKSNVDDLLKRTSNVPSMGSINATISERFSKIDTTLRADVDKKHRDMTTQMDKFCEVLETLKAQFKGLNKMWNQAMADVTKAGSVVADMDATKVEVASLSRDVSKLQGMKSQLDKLDTWVCELSIAVKNGTSPGVSPADLVARLEEQKRQIDALKSGIERPGIISQLDEKIAGVAKTLHNLILALDK